MDIKIQTKRMTKFLENIKNINIFVTKDFEIGVVTTSYWGDFNKREKPLIEIEIKGEKYNCDLDSFIKKMEKAFVKEKVMERLK